MAVLQYTSPSYQSGQHETLMHTLAQTLVKGAIRPLIDGMKRNKWIQWPKGGFARTLASRLT